MRGWERAAAAAALSSGQWLPACVRLASPRSARVAMGDHDKFVLKEKQKLQERRRGSWLGGRPRLTRSRMQTWKRI